MSQTPDQYLRWKYNAEFIKGVPGATAALGFLDSLPGLHNIIHPFLACLQQSDPQKRAQFFSMSEVHKFAPWIAIGAGILSGAWALYEYGPLPGALLAGPIVAGVLWCVIDGVACAMEGKTIIDCMLGDALSFVQHTMKSVLGVDVNSFTAPIASAEVKVLNAFGCGLDPSAVIDKS